MAEKTGYLGLSGPTLVRGGIGEETDIAELAGPKMHAETTGLIDHVDATEEECIGSIKTFLQFMPSSAWDRPQSVKSEDSDDRACPDLMRLVPHNPRKPYDVKPVIEEIFDRGNKLEFKPNFGKGIVTMLARLGGDVVGVVASQPKFRGGVIDATAAFKGRRFVALCDAFNIPLVFLQDQPGFLPGRESEAANIIYWGNTFLAAVQRATVPKLTLVLRKAHGAAMWAMGFGGEYGEGADLVAAWPSAVLTGTGPASAVFTIHSKELAAASDPNALRTQLEAQYSATGSAYRGAMSFGIQTIVEPQETRRYFVRALKMASQKLTRNLGPKPQLFP
jgi:acetyl-CoA carboxylase carboxyltransferase component